MKNWMTVICIFELMNPQFVKERRKCRGFPFKEMYVVSAVMMQPGEETTNNLHCIATHRINKHFIISCYPPLEAVLSSHPVILCTFSPC